MFHKPMPKIQRPLPPSCFLHIIHAPERGIWVLVILGYTAGIALNKQSKTGKPRTQILGIFVFQDSTLPQTPVSAAALDNSFAKQAINQPPANEHDDLDETFKESRGFRCNYEVFRDMSGWGEAICYEVHSATV